MRLQSIGKLAALAGTLCAILAIPGAAQAKEIVPASNCLFQPDTGEYNLNESGIANISSGLNWHVRPVFCPVSTAVREQLTGSIFVDVHDGDNTNASTGRVLASVCLQAFSGAAVECSAPTEITRNTETGNFDRTLDSEDLALLRRASSLDFYASLRIQLPAWNLSQSRLFGYSAF
jgi:hypothetical protein